MKISSLNQTVQNKNFKGLWKEPRVKIDFDPILNVPKIKDTYFYHPFANETEQEIKDTIKRVNKAEFINDNGTVKYYVRECRLCLKTPFTKEEFEAYTNISSGFVGKKEKAIHEAVQGKYLNSPLDGEQKSASNPHIEEII